MALTKATYSMIEGASLNVLDFGAVGDGVTDDSVAIQAAIDAIPGIGGEVYFPGGTYLVNTKIVLKGRLSLIGESRNNTSIKAGTVGMTVVEQNGSAYNIRIKYLNINGDGKAAYGLSMVSPDQASSAHHIIEDISVSSCTTNCIYLNRHIYLRFVEVYADNAPTVVLVEGVNSSVFDQCLFYNATATACLSIVGGSQAYLRQVNLYNDGPTFISTQLLLVDGHHGGTFFMCTFEPLSPAGTNVTNSVTLQSTIPGSTTDNQLIACRFIGTNNTQIHAIEIGAIGTVYKTIIQNCQFIKPVSTESIKLTAQTTTQVIGCVDLVTYDTPVYFPVTILNLTGNPVYVENLPGTFFQIAALTDNANDIGNFSVRWRNTHSVNFIFGSLGVLLTSAAGSPEGVVTALVGSLYTRTNGSTGTTLYVKESGSGNTGWVAK
jgi:hypothetical protein